MKKTVKEFYDLDVEIIIKITNKVYRLKCSQGDFIFKFIDNQELEAIYSRINVLNLKCFVIPLKNKYEQYLSIFNDELFEITPFYKDELIQAKDIRLKVFLNKLALLHKTSAYDMNVNKGFFIETYELIKKELELNKKNVDDYLFSIEAKDYKSPSEWLFLMNNQLFVKSFDDALNFNEEFKEKTSELSSLRVTLVYQNFDYSHILLKEDKILGCQKINISPPIYDIKYLFDTSYHGSIDLLGYIKEYFNEFSFKEYELYWLMSILYLNSFNFNELNKMNEIDKIVVFSRLIKHFKCANELTFFLKSLINKE